MLDILDQVEKELPRLLAEKDQWQSLNINYHPPFVERVYRSWEGYRIYLHKIHPCGPGEALFHPHPWPSAMHILSGKYEMAVGYGSSDTPPPEAVKLIASGDLKYEMTDINSWHYVRPIDEMAMTLMVTGKPWRRKAPGKNQDLVPLLSEAKEEIIAFFRDYFS